MNKMTMKRTVLRLVGVGVLWVLGGWLLLGSVPVLTNHSWYATLRALNHPYLHQLWFEFAAGVLLWVGAVYFAVWFVRVKRKGAI